MRGRAVARTSIVALLGLLLVCLSPGRVFGRNAKNLTTCETVFVGLGDIIDRELVAVRSRFYNKPDRFALHLTLDEERVSGQTVFLGEQTVLLAATTLVALDGPNGRPLVEVAWSTPAIQDGSDITACVEVIDVMTGNISSEWRCSTLFPVIPL